MGKVQYLPFAESVELIKNRQLDATLQSSGLGMAAIRVFADENACNRIDDSVIKICAGIVRRVSINLPIDLK